MYLFSLPSRCNSHIWARSKTGFRNCIAISKQWAGTQVLGHFPLLSQTHWQRAELEVQQLGLHSALWWRLQVLQATTSPYSATRWLQKPRFEMLQWKFMLVLVQHPELTVEQAQRVNQEELTPSHSHRGLLKFAVSSSPHRSHWC